MTGYLWDKDSYPRVCPAGNASWSEIAIVFRYGHVEELAQRTRRMPFMPAKWDQVSGGVGG
jgi:hypothetical protein